ncbi:MAG TPA: tripartite tricarboxylate transporter substrate binding protein [Geminicoccaceae bacterium]|nr:tripartite tricarboxylate transporter substrate binding protein [Geminicoccaceae bacterium]
MLMTAWSPSPRLSTPALLGAALVCGLALAAPAQAQIKEILVPANPGGGWDQTARAMQEALQEAGISDGVQVVNVGGAGGTIGLAQFATSNKRRGDTVMVGGLVMLGAILTNESAVTLEDVTPLARLTGEYEVLVVPAGSPIKNMDDLVAKLKEDPGSVSWGGGSAGGTDHIVAGLIAQAAGVDPTKVNYIAHAGGGEALASILGGHVTVGVSGYQEFASQIEEGQLRGIGITADAPVEGIPVPTLKEQGIDVSLVNWRGVFAPPGIRDADMEKLSEAVAKMVESPQWQETLKQRGWLNMYMPAEEFAAFIEEDREKVEGTLKSIGLVQ